MNDTAVAGAKQAARTTWASGNWDEVADYVSAAGPALIERVGIEPAMEVLDVGCGSGGSVAIPAALKGATVIGSDLTPELFDGARRRAAEANVAIEWVEADAESLPFEDGRFDRVLSTFGHMFAPRHAIAAAELARVCKPGGIVGFCTWATDGVPGLMFKTVGSRMPAPPEFAQPPALWGDEQHIRELLEPLGLEVEVETGQLYFEHESFDGYTAMMENSFGPLVMAQRALGEDGFASLREELHEIFSSHNQATDGSFNMPGKYTLTVARKPG